MKFFAKMGAFEIFREVPAFDEITGDLYYEKKILSEDIPKMAFI